MINELPKLLERDFILAFYLPAVLFVIAVYFALGPLLPLPPEILAASAGKSEDAVSLATVGALVAVLIAFVLMVANISLIRILEGYPPWLRNLPWFGDRQADRFAFVRGRLGYLEENWDEVAAGGAVALERARDERNRLLRESVERFPDDEDLLLPTALGNVLRAFECYPRVMYGLDSIAGWPRLIAVIPEAFGKSVGSAKAGVDFWINTAYLSALVVPALVVRLLHDHAGALAAPWSGLPAAAAAEMLLALAALLLAALCYRLAVTAAIDWGHTVKAAFDLYLPDLARQLGYEPPLSRDVWERISKSFVYWYELPPRRPPDPPDWAG